MIIGPDLSEHRQGGSPGSDLYESLTDLSTPQYDILTSSAMYPGHVDIFSFHYYPISGSWGREHLIGKPYYSHHFSSNPTNTLSTFNNRLNNMQAWLVSDGNPYRKIAVTEFNITTANETANDIGDESTNSFLAGQFFAEMLAVGMWNRDYWAGVFGMYSWSIHESGGDRSSGDLGLLDGGSFEKRSTYHHLRMMAQEFQIGRMEVCTTLTQSGPWGLDSDNFKAFAVRSCTGAAVMIMNQNASGLPLSYVFNFDNSGLPATHDMEGHINMEWEGKKIESNMTNALGSIDPQETHVYVLNNCGQIMESYEYNIADNQNNYGAPVYSSGLAGECACDEDEDINEWYERFPDYSPHRIGSHRSITAISENNIQFQSEVVAWPNPAGTAVTFSGYVENAARLVLTDCLGKTVEERDLGKGEFAEQMTLQNLSPGLYLYTIMIDGQKTASKKLIVQ